jgi:hypothetical protein
MYQDYLVTTLFSLGSFEMATLYDGRGGIESDIMEFPR